MKTFLSVGLAAVVLGAVSSLVACGGGSGGDDGQLLGNNATTAIPEISDAGVSESNLEGTACADPGGYITCHDTLVVIDGFRYCDGTRSCDVDSSTWGPCVNTLVIGSGDGG